MRQVEFRVEIEQIEFAKRAAKCFAEDSTKHSFSDDGELNPGCFLALRWGMGGDCVLVMRLDDYHIPTNYAQLVKLATSEKLVSSLGK